MEPSTPKFTPPYTREEVESINAFQASGVFHPFTCPNEDHDPGQVNLEATEQGMRCPQCDYTQGWVWHWMADDGWRTIWGLYLNGPSEDDDDEIEEEP